MANLARLGVASGFGFLAPARRLRHRPGADRVQLVQHLRPRLPRRLPQHDPGGGGRHHPRDHHRLHDGHRPAVAQLAGQHAGRRSTSRSSATSRCCCSCCWSTPSSSTSLPQPRESGVAVRPGAAQHRRPVLPRPLPQPGFGVFVVVSLLALLAIPLVLRWAARKRELTGQPVQTLRFVAGPAGADPGELLRHRPAAAAGSCR